MPLFSYFCEDCQKETEFFTPLNALPLTIPCSACGRDARRVIVKGHGGFQSTSPTWLDDAHAGLKDPSEPPFESRTDWKKHLKENDIIERG